MSRDYVAPTVRQALDAAADYIRQLDDLRDQVRGDVSKAHAYTVALMDAAEQLVGVHAIAVKLLRINESEGFLVDVCRSTALMCDKGSDHLSRQRHSWWHHDPSGVWWRRTNGGSVELHYGSTPPA